VVQNISFSEDRSWDATVQTVTSYGLDSPGFKSQQGQEVSLIKNCPECLSGLHSLLMNSYQGSFLGVKWLGHEVDPSPPSSTEVKNEWHHTFSPPLRLHGTHRHNFTFQLSRYVNYIKYHRRPIITCQFMFIQHFKITMKNYWELKVCLTFLGCHIVLQGK
jgi:hypothetical protein